MEKKWAPVLEGIQGDYERRCTAQLLENQAKAIMAESMNEAAVTNATTTVGKLGTFQKFAFPLVRRIYPELIFNKIGAVQPMNGPVSQIFYLGHSRHSHNDSGVATEQLVYSKYNLTYRGLTSEKIGSLANATSGLGGGTGQFLDLDGNAGDGKDGDDGEFDLSNVLRFDAGAPSSTFGGKIAGWPDSATILGYSVSAGERLSATSIPEISYNIEQQPVVARTRKMRALWTLEAAQDLRAYHDLDLEKELTELLSNEVELEIDRELIEDIRMLAYDPNTALNFGGWHRASLDQGNSNNFEAQGGGQGPFNSGDDFVPAQFLYDFSNAGTGNPSGSDSNVFVIDFSSSALPFAPQHVGHVWANLLAVVNLASQDIYKTTHRGPGSWLLTSPLMASLLESAAKLEGGMQAAHAPTNIGNTSIEYKGKFASKYDLYVDPLYPDDEILVGYKGANPMDAGFVYAPYIPLQQLPTITDPETFQPRKGLITRYGKAAVAPAARYYRIVRVIGPTANYLFTPFLQNGGQGVQVNSTIPVS